MSRSAQIAFLSRFAGAYDPVVRRMGFPGLWDALASLVAPTAGQPLLDVCTGTGGTALALARRNARVVGIDAAEGMLQRARRKRDRAGFGHNPLFVRMDARHLAFPDQAFPHVVCSMALHEMAEDERCEVLGEIHRVARHRATIAEYRVPPRPLPAALFRLRRFFEYIESDDFEAFVRRDLGARLAEAGFLVTAHRDVGPYRIWSCRVRRK